jgi:hypothetical protein
MKNYGKKTGLLLRSIGFQLETKPIAHPLSLENFFCKWGGDVFLNS